MRVLHLVTAILTATLMKHARGLLKAHSEAEHSYVKNRSVSE